PAPFGICLVADYLSAAMVLITAVIHTAVTAYARHDIDSGQVRTGFYPFMQMLTAAVCGAFLTGDLFNLYVWFEVMLMASFGLLVMGRSPGRLTGGVKYVTVNLISTLFFITAIGLIYGLTGTLNMADLHAKAAEVENTALLNAAAMLLMIAFGIKAALFPLFFWLPAAYHTLPVSVSAFFAGMLSKVGVYALIRMFTLVFTASTEVTHATLLVVAALTMLFGVVGAASQMEMRRILSFHIISQVGYMVLGLALFTPLALAGAIVYLVHHIIVKANLFLVSGLVQQAGGTFNLKRIGGLYKTNGLLAIGFIIPAFALAGFPPLSGFWAKLLIIKASLESQQYVLAVLSALVGLLTVFSMIKIWSEAFWKPAPTGEQVSPTNSPLSPWMLVPVLSLALVTVLMGLCMEPVIRFSMSAAGQLMDPRVYIEAVLGGRP
ncbi:MAG: Na+/H+ antiporter subunit D, partial [Deltaproteobacteria bacterium]|nr:Na+/H+ antiporter subunit D [Deltaproteobacteria bacterium]